MLKKYIAVVENAQGIQKEVIIAKNRKQALTKISEGECLVLKVQMELTVDKDKVMNGFKASGLSDVEIVLLEEVLTKGGVFGKPADKEKKPVTKKVKKSGKADAEAAKQTAHASK